MTPILLSILACFGTVAHVLAQQLPSDPPNIVILLADDAGWNDVGYHGSEIRTPHIDRMAREGVELDQFYVYPTCSPSRAALLTGRPPSRFGIHEPIAGQSQQTLPADVTTLPDVLRRQGYHTALIGKWHLGLRPEAGPQRFGFDYGYGALHGQVDPYTHRYKFGDETWHRNGEIIEEEGHATDLIARDAIRFLRELRDPSRPFLLYISFTVPHYPLDEPAEYVHAYENSIHNESRRRYAAAMTHMDDAIGQVLATLESEGLTRNTLVVFASDNGGQQSWESVTAEYNGRYPAHDVLGDNSPLRGWKNELSEGGVRVPAIVSWPGRLTRRKVTEPIIVYDLLPTLASLAGVDSSAVAEVEGVDVWLAIETGAALPERPLYWRSPGAQAIRIGDWKLIQQGASLGNVREELFDLARDPFETQDLSVRRPDILARLRRALAQQMEADRAQRTPS
jgi:arylsulfatase B